MQAVEAGTVKGGSYLLVEQFDRLSRAKPILAFRKLEQLISSGTQVVTNILLSEVTFSHGETSVRTY
jgi:DNA invertase Pin-like site-specific DNA recombinase